jgi:YD repeat-containing protein
MISVTIDGYASYAYYANGSTDASVAGTLTSQINTSGAPVTAVQNGASITITATITGTATDYPITISNGDFTISDPQMALSGGKNAPTIYSYTVPTGGYDANGNLLGFADTVMGSWGFGYDTLNQLVTTRNTASTSVSTQYAGMYGCWNYDAFGNRLVENYSVVTTMPCVPGAPPGALFKATPVNTTLNNNQLAASVATYDGAGNVLNDDYNQYLYDAEGRLCAVAYPSGTGYNYDQYLYDASGVRVGKGSLTAWPSSCNAPTAANNFTLTNQYLLDQGGDQVTELDGAGNWKHSNLWAGGHLQATYDQYGLHFAIADPLGTKRVQVIVSGLTATLGLGNNIGDPRTTDCVQVGNGGTDATDITSPAKNAMPNQATTTSGLGITRLAWAGS